MQIIVKSHPEELQRARNWWQGLELQWKMAYNETAFGKGPTMEPPKDDELMLFLMQVDTLRFAGPGAQAPNMTTVLTNLSGLVPLYRLRYISVSNTRITSLKPLANHRNLVHLFAYDNQLASLEGIENLSHLKDLYVQNNQIKDLKPLKKLLNLETVYVSGNQLQELKGISKSHAKKMRNFYAMPNPNLRDSEILKFQNRCGIICKTG